MSKAQIFQIYYDEKSKNQLDSGFIGLDNSAAKVDGWYEFNPILNYLEANTLEEDVWYGFLSPKFKSKTRCDSAYVKDFLTRIPAETEVAIFSPGWDQLAYFLNPWEQGEIWHPKLADITEEFLTATDRSGNLRALVTDATTSVFSNYFVAKKRFWMAWMQIAKEFQSFVLTHETYNKELISYGSLHNQAPMKTFVQERLASYLLATGHYVTASTLRPREAPVIKRIFPEGESIRKILELCDKYKHLYRKTNNTAYIEAFYLARRQIKFSKPY